MIGKPQPYIFRFTRGIAYSTMDRKKLDKLKRELAHLRRSPQRALALQGLAKKLGRKSVKRGKEPMWESTEFPQLFVLAIPDHGGEGFGHWNQEQHFGSTRG